MDPTPGRSDDDLEPDVLPPHWNRLRARATMKPRRHLAVPPNRSAPPLRHTEVPPAGFLMQSRASTSKGIVHRFIAALPLENAIDALSAAGRYSQDVFLDREDATAALICTILGYAHLIMYDINHDRGQELRASNEALVEEVIRKSDSIDRLAAQCMEFRRQNILGNIYSGDDSDE
ncbi:hypothetical protein PIB30_044032 [Stylosanthes scabra]|uniref:Uncharacterized protein n=1 Tax=Stylosanthes scabra TaxID=79078 RepID=A0ABU6QGE4_9FABA|nr:hypothetical protein [Stylosanthes scabra]